MNPNLLYQWIELIEMHFCALGKWQAVGLAIYSVLIGDIGTR